MPTTVAELTVDGDFKLAGNVNTRLPVITNGLIANYPFDGIAVDTVSSATPQINTNNTLTVSEISIEEATTNLVTNGGLSSGTTGWSTNQSVTISVVKPDGYTNYLQIVSNQAGSTPGFISTTAFAVSPGTTYTFSLEGYKSYSGSCYLYVWASATGNLVWQGKALSTTEQKYVNTFTTGASDTSIKVGVLWSGVAVGDWFRVKKIQVEQKAFATAFTPTSRALGATQFTNILGTAGTIAFKFSKDIVPTSGYQMPFRVANNVFEFNITTSVFLGAAAQSITQYMDYWAFITWNLSSNFLKIYFGSTMVGSSGCPSYVSGFGTTYPYFYLGCGDSGGSYVFNGTFKNFLIYNRALSDAEIKELSTNTFELTSAGDLITSSINTKPAIPTDVYYFPLGFDTKDQCKMIGPSGSANIPFNFGSAWIGEAATNVFVYPSFENAASNGGWSHWGAAGSSGTYGQTTDRSFIWYNVNLGYQTYAHWVTNASGATGDYLLYQAPSLSAGSDRAVSAVIKMSDGSPVTNAKVYPTWNSRDSGSPNNAWVSIEDIGGGFYLCKTPGIHQDGTDDLVGFYVKPGYTAYFSFCQLENTRYTSPFVNTSRARSYLYYTPSTMGITLASGDWTFGVFVKTDATILASTGTRYNTIEIGQYYVSGSTSLTMFHETSANVFYGVVYEELTGRTAPGSITLNSADLAKVLFVGFKKLGTTITMFCVSPTNGLQQTSITQSWTVALYDRVWVGGYNWSSGNYYCKDFIAAKRALTDTELTSIYKEKLDTKDITRIQGSIQTVQTLT